MAPDCGEDTGGFFVTTPFDDPAYADRLSEVLRYLTNSIHQDVEGGAHV